MLELPWRARRTPQAEKFDVFIAGTLMIGGVLMFTWLEWLTSGTVAILLGMIAAYATAARIFNTTHIHITRDELRVNTTPFAFLTGSANHTTPTADIQRTIIHVISDSNFTGYAVNVCLQDDTERHLLTLHDAPELIKQVAQHIHDFLGIEEPPTIITDQESESHEQSANS